MAPATAGINMPPKGQSARGKGKVKGPNKTLETDVEEDLDLVDTEDATDEAESEELLIEEKIAELFEVKPFFYELTLDKYKNKQLRVSDLAEFANSIGWTADQVWTRFTSNRTEHGKLKNPKLNKSGKAATKLTTKQPFKLERYSFLDRHIVHRLYLTRLPV